MPVPTSATSGTDSVAHAGHEPGSSRLHALDLAVGHFEHELVVHLQEQPGREALAVEPACTAIIASLMRSAAVPCIGALIAARSAAARRGPPPALMSGSHSRRPNTVST